MTRQEAGDIADQARIYAVQVTIEQTYGEYVVRFENPETGHSITVKNAEDRWMYAIEQLY